MTQIGTTIDHETGNLSQYTTTTTSGSGTVAASTSANLNGSYGLRSVVNSAVDSNDQAAGEKNSYSWPASNTFYWTFLFRFPSGTFTQAGHYNSATTKAVAFFEDPSSFQRMFWLLIADGTRTLRLAYKAKDNSDNFAGSGVALGDGTLYYIKMLLDKSGANPIVTWWYSTDGSSYTQGGTATDSTSGTNGVGKTVTALNYRGGIRHVSQFDLCQYTVDVDDLAAWDADPTGVPQGLVYGARPEGYRGQIQMQSLLAT